MDFVTGYLLGLLSAVAVMGVFAWLIQKAAVQGPRSSIIGRDPANE